MYMQYKIVIGEVKDKNAIIFDDDVDTTGCKKYKSMNKKII